MAEAGTKPGVAEVGFAGKGDGVAVDGGDVKLGLAGVKVGEGGGVKEDRDAIDFWGLPSFGVRVTASRGSGCPSPTDKQPARQQVISVIQKRMRSEAIIRD